MTLNESYAYCSRVARTRAKNFYYSFLLLSREQRRAMCAIYAFMRYCDDLSDEPGATPEAMIQWRAALDAALAGETGGHPCLPAFADTVARFGIPHACFHDMIDGVSSDLTPRRIATFDELYRYCYQVASTVGITITHIFGFDPPSRKNDALLLAEKCGIAFQLTNILRDVREDHGLGRIYLPAGDLARFGVDPDALGGAESGAVLDLLRFEIERARGYYRESRPLLDLVEKRSRRSLWALIEVYSRLLDRIASDPAAVLRRRVSLGAAEKLGILARAFL